MRLLAITVLNLLLPTALVSATEDRVPMRSEIPTRYTWDLTLTYADEHAWETDFRHATEQILALRAAVADSAATPVTNVAELDKWHTLLELREGVRWRVDKLVVYSHQLSDQDTRDQAAQAMKQRAAALQVAYAEATAWIEPTLLRLPAGELVRWSEQHAGLAVYRHYFDNLERQRPHKLSTREEELLAMASRVTAAPYTFYSTLRGADLVWRSMTLPDGSTRPLSHGRYDQAMRSSDRTEREAAFRATMATYGAMRNTFAAALSAGVQANIFHARARGFTTPLAATQFPDQLPESVYRHLVETVSAHLPLLHRWTRLRREILGLDAIHSYDLYQPLFERGARLVPYDEAVVMIVAALAPLGEEYAALARRAFDERWVDALESQGKRPGGYSWGSYDTPPYILVNYNGTARDVSILMHELGHSLHSYYTHTTQPRVYGDYSLFVAEVAAIFNELLLQEYQLARATSQTDRLALLDEQIDHARITLFRQVMFAEFEHALHQAGLADEPLTADRIGALFTETHYRFWGPELARDAEVTDYWTWIPHFYMNHYVYKYATSYCAAAALAERVLRAEPGAREDYLAFLRAGSSAYPLEIMRSAGVDLTTPAYITAALRRFERLLDELETTRSAAP